MTRFASAFTAILISQLGLAAALCAAEPIYLERPFDQVTLDENNGSAALKVFPLPFPGRKVPAPEQRAGDLQIELIDRAGQKFNVAWANVVSVKLFEQFVLEEAQEHVIAGRYDEAFPYFQFLERKYPATPGLKEAIENFLYVQIGQEFKAKRFDHALALLVNLHDRSPQKAGVSVAYDRVTAELVKSRIAEQNYVAARGLLRNLAARFPETQATTVATYQAQLIELAKARQTEAQAHLAAGKLREAHESARQMLAIWPALAGGRELAQSIHQQYPVVTVGRTSDVVQPLANANAADGRQASIQLVEVPLHDSAAAVAALKHGEIDVLDRVSPWELKRLSASTDIAVAPYAQPTIHLLVANPSKQLAASRVLRRAIAYGIDRDGILRRTLLGGQTIEGCETLSGPLLRGAGYDASLAPKPYDPALATVLVGADPAATSSASLVLAHPAGPIPRLACQSIAGQLTAIGLPVTLRELAPGETPGTNYDLLYVEFMANNPAEDAAKVLGTGGMAGQCSPAMLQALRAVERSADDAAKAAALQNVHRLAAAELPVIPLWQLAEHFAHQTSVSGIGERPMTLYQNKPAWQATLRVPTE